MTKIMILLNILFQRKTTHYFLPKIKGFKRRLYLISCVSLKLHLCTSLRGNQRQIQSYDWTTWKQAVHSLRVRSSTVLICLRYDKRRFAFSNLASYIFTVEIKYMQHIHTYIQSAPRPSMEVILVSLCNCCSSIRESHAEYIRWTVVVAVQSDGWFGKKENDSIQFHKRVDAIQFD